jgi:hypothetical protein
LLARWGAKTEKVVFNGQTPGRRVRASEGGEWMSYDGIKLIYIDGKPQWLMPDGSFVPAESRKGEVFMPGALYLRDRSVDSFRLIRA